MPIRLKAWQWLVFALIAIVALDWFIQRPDSRSRDLNDILAKQASEQLRNYPYRFRVLRMAGNTAVMATPRNVDVPAFKFLGVLYPNIDVKNPNDPDFIKAETLLGAVQSEARQIVAAQPGIKDVKWELDRDWLSAHGIDMPAK